jgi:hypothetical protein
MKLSSGSSKLKKRPGFGCSKEHFDLGHNCLRLHQDSFTAKLVIYLVFNNRAQVSSSMFLSSIYAGRRAKTFSNDKIVSDQTYVLPYFFIFGLIWLK